MKIRLCRLLLALSLMITGLAVILTILHATLVGFYFRSYEKTPEHFLHYLKLAGLTPWMFLSAVAYGVGLILLLTSELPGRKKQNGEEAEK